MLAGSLTRIYLGNDDHTDYMWTTDADTYNAVFVEMLDYYLALADDTEADPSPYQSRFNTDGSYWLWQYERQKTPAEFERLLGRVKDGHISVPLNTLVSCYGGQPTEAILRGLYYAGRLERRYHLRFVLAVAMENQTLPLGLASLWAGAGARYSWKGVCGCASRISNTVLSRRPHEIYWYTGPDGQHLLTKWYSLGPHQIGTYLEADHPENAIEFLDSDAEFLRRYTHPATSRPYSARAAFGFGGDCLARKTGVPAVPDIPNEPGQLGVIGFPYTDHFHTIARRQTTDTRQVIVSNIVDFFEDFEEKYGADLPSESVTYGNEWDLYSASMAETSARVRRSVEKLRAAELMSTLVSLQKPNFLRGREKARDQAFTALGLYWEHDWTADGPISPARRAAWQEMLASEIEYYVNPLHADAAARLGYLIRNPAAAPRFFVLNCLGHERSDFADFLYAGPAEVHVREVAGGQEVPHQIVTQAGVRRLRVWAAAVPATGYKTYEILSGPGSAPQEPAATVHGDPLNSDQLSGDPLSGDQLSGDQLSGDQLSGDQTRILENSEVKLVLEPGGVIRSLIDKRRTGTELAADIAGLKLNALSHGADQDANQVPDRSTHQGTIDPSTIQVENSGPVSVTLRCTGGADLPHTTWVTLYRHSDRVDICNRITANFSDTHYWSFSFHVTDPHIHAEELGMILRERLHSQGGDYADSHARYDHVTLNHFADITNGAGTHGVTLSNADCSFAKLGRSSAHLLDTNTPQIHVLAGGQIDGKYLGIPDQNGAAEFLQRFALRPHGAYDPAAAMQFALEHQNPLVTGVIPGAAAGPYPAGRYCLLTLSDPRVQLWALKPAEEGIEEGVIARLWNLAGSPCSVRVTPATGLGGAAQTTHIETNLAALPITEGSVALQMTQAQLQTIRLHLPLESAAEIESAEIRTP